MADRPAAMAEISSVPGVPNSDTHHVDPLGRYRLTNPLYPPFLVAPNAPSVEPATYTPRKSTATARTSSVSAVPTCFVHSSAPAWLYLRTNPSTPPPR